MSIKEYNMAKYLWLAAAAAALLGCQAGPARQKGSAGMTGKAAGNAAYILFWDTAPRNNQLIFHGVSGKFLDPNEGVRRALEDAARRVALFRSATGSFTHRENIGAGFLDYSSTREASISTDENYKDLVEALDFDPEGDVLVTDDATFVRTRYTLPDPPALVYRAKHRRGRPEWVDNPPEDISGFLAGIGYANPRFYHKDTVIASYENALYALVSAISHGVQTTSQTKTRDTAFTGFDTTTEHLVSASEELRGFYVLETWIDPANKGVYTLAIAQRPPTPTVSMAPNIRAGS